jgi:shikimate kinase
LVDGRAPLADRPIALAGFMGVGKSTLGRRLAANLDRDFFDTDDRVEQTSGRSILEFFSGGQEAEFRRLECEAVRELLRLKRVVIGLGGGALMDSASRRRLEEESFLVHLHVPWPELRSRLAGLVATRPLLQGRSTEEIHQLYLSRLSTYAGAALQVTVSRDDTGQALEAILRRLSPPD